MNRLAKTISLRRVIASCLIAVIAVYALSWMPRSRLHSDEPPVSQGRLATEKFRLADGTEIPLEEWGETYETYERAPSLEAAESRVLLQLPDGDPRQFYAVAADPSRKQLYWLTHRPGSERCQIGVVNYDGKGARVVRDRLTGAGGLLVDFEKQRLYWTAADPGGGFALYRANLDGNAEEILVRGLRSPARLTLDSTRGQIYYHDYDHVVSVSVDGGPERHLMQGSVRALGIEPASNRLYWFTDKALCSAKLTSTEIATSDVRVEPIPRPGNVWNVVTDPTNSKIYWGDGHGVCRANLDGSLLERIADVAGSADSYAAVDAINGRLFWTANNRWRIHVGTLPPLPKKVVKAEPPVIRHFLPEDGAAEGESLVLIGSGFTGTTAVACVDDVGGRHVAVKFAVDSNEELKLAMPKLPPDCERFSVIICTPNGVTVILPSDTATIKKTVSLKRDGNDQRAAFLVLPGGWLAHLEQRIGFVQQNGLAQPGVRGATFFLKNGSCLNLSSLQGNVIYREPFTDVHFYNKGALNNTYIDTPAIRPSFMASLPTLRRKPKPK